jgi:hypothetical protein
MQDQAGLRSVSIKDIRRQFEQDKFARTWSAAVQARYLDFCKHLMQAERLSVKTGAGGLSFYKELDGERVFVCHFNARPRSAQIGLGFADFRRDALEGRLNVDRVLGALRRRLGPQVEVKEGKLWCGLHFSLRLAPRVADAFRIHIISPMSLTTPRRIEKVKSGNQA